MDLGIFGIIDIVIIVLGLLVLFIGFKRGFMNKMIGLLGVLVMFALAIALAANFAEFLKNREIFYPSIYDSIHDKVKEAVEAAGPEADMADVISNALGIPGLLASFIASKVDVTTAELPNAVAEMLGNIFMRFIAFGILVLLFTIVLITLKILAKTVRKNSIIRTFDGVLGMALYLLIYVLVLSLFFFILNLMISHDAITGNTLEFIKTDLQLDSDKFRISKFLYEGNVFKSIKDLFA